MKIVVKAQRFALMSFSLLTKYIGCFSDNKVSSPMKNKDQVSLSSGDSMLSIHSDKGTSLHEAVSCVLSIHFDLYETVLSIEEMEEGCGIQIICLDKKCNA